MSSFYTRYAAWLGLSLIYLPVGKDQPHMSMVNSGVVWGLKLLAGAVLLPKPPRSMNMMPTSIGLREFASIVLVIT